MKRKAIILLLALGSFVPMGRAATINFASPVPSLGKYSAGTDWQTDGSFHFEIGVFSSGFTPSLANVDQWLVNWNLANADGFGATTWIVDAGDTYFVGSGEYATNTGAWAIGSKVYIWGFDARTTGTNQWILLQNSTAWLTVDSSTISPQAFQTFDGGTAAVVGSVNGTGNSFQSASITVVPEPSTWVLLALGLTTIVVLRRRMV